MLYGRSNYNPASRFLREIPAELLLDMNQQTAQKRAAERKSAAPSLGAAGVAAPVKAAGSTAAVSADYQINDTIDHKKWGQGVIVGISGSGEELSLRVIFPDIGMKDLFVKYAPIHKVESAQ